MKIYVSGDIEGVTGVTVWDEAGLGKPEYAAFQEQMTAEVGAACEGALAAGATTIHVKDAHHTGRNIIAAKLPSEAHLIRGWSGHPYMMLEGLDESYDGVAMIGYHSASGSGANPLSHTLTPRVVEMRLNGRLASEFLLGAYTAALVGVPVLFLSGDQGLCDEVGEFDATIRTVAVKEGIGNSTRSIHPDEAVSRIRDGVADALRGGAQRRGVSLPSRFTVEIRYKEHVDAFRYAFYPGAELENPFTLRFETDDYFEVLRLLLFTT